MSKFVATINTPGYLPEGDPAEFDTAAEAWDYLADERKRAEDDAWQEGDSEEYSATRTNLATIAAHWDAKVPTNVHPLNADGTGVIYGDTPGYDGEHDQGKAYCVSVVETRTVKAEALTRGNFIVTADGEHKEISYTDWQGSRIFVVFMDGRTSPYDNGDDVEILSN